MRTQLGTFNPAETTLGAHLHWDETEQASQKRARAVCEETKALNVYSRSDEEIGRLMSNFAPTSFTLDGVSYGSIEGFYVSLLFLEEEKRKKVRNLHGIVAKNMGKKSRLTRTCYAGEWFELGSDTHIALIKRGIRAKLEAHPEIARAFVATRPRPIVHDVGHPDPEGAVFPAAVFVRILTELREEFAKQLSMPAR